MSTESSLDPQLIEQTKKQIRSLVAEIAQLTKENVAPEEFYGQFLPRVVSALAAVGGAVWVLNDEGRLALQYQVNVQESKLREKSEEEQINHGRLLRRALMTGEGALVPPHSGAGEAGDDEQGANPTSYLLVLGPLKTDLETVGVVEIFQRSEAGPTTQKGYLRFLLQMCELAGDYLKSHQLRHFSDRQVLWSQLEDFTRAVHTNLDPRDTAYTIANEGRRLIECDRVSVAIQKGNKCRIEAVSGQDLLDKRSNTVRLLGRLATAVVATGEPIWYTGDTRDMAPQVEDAVEEYVDESHSKTVAVLPLHRPDTRAEEEPDKRHDPEPPIGALIVEQIEDSRVPPAMAQRVDVVCRHSAAALGNALEHQNLFLMPVWRAIGKARWVVKGRTLPKTLSITAAVLVLLLLVIIWPADFELESDGTLEPVVRRDVFAATDGEIVELRVEHGTQVQAGDVVAKLRNLPLEEKVEKLLGDRNATLEQISSLRRQITEAQRSGQRAELTRLHGEEATAKEKLKSLEIQWNLCKKQIEDLQVTSPIDGQVLTWDVENLLKDRSVNRGQALIRVADPSGPWQLELQMPEKRMGHIANAQQELYKQLREQLRELLDEQARQQLGEVPDEQIEAAVTAKLDAVPDQALGARLRAELLQQLQTEVAALLNPTANPVPAEGEEASPSLDETTRQKLTEASQQPDFEQARGVLREVIDEVPDGEVRDRLEELTEIEINDRLPVTFILASDPDVELEGMVKEVNLRAEVKGEEGNIVLIKVEIDKERLPHIRPGATVTAKVYCGKRSLAYVWLHDLIGFVQSRILFRFF